MTNESIAVVGPGRMGIGIATAVLMAGQGHRVTLIDTKKREPGKESETLHRARAEIEANLKLIAGLGLLKGDVAKLEGDLELTSAPEEGIAGRSFVFEALPEKVAVKQEFYQTVGPLLDEAAVIASATSTFHLDVFWDVCAKPGNVVSAHWLNPAFLIPLVEGAYGEETGEWAATRMIAFLKAIGKIPVKLRTSPGFIVPRIQAAAMNEAVRILEEEVTTPQEIDTAIKAGFGFRLGVLGLIEFVDLGGLDILFHAGEYLHSTLGGEHFKPPELVREKMERAETGPRSGKGFYDYADVDVRALFDHRYKGFAELLRLYERCEYLNFAGGIAAGESSQLNASTTNRKETP